MPNVFIKADFKNIRFKCRRCGTCCHHKRPAQFGSLIPSQKLPDFWACSNLIYLNATDIERISDLTQLEPDRFVDTLYPYEGHLVYVEDNGKKLILDLPVLKSKEDTTCIFYDQGCTIYPVRPRACRLFPFRVEEESTEQGDITLNIRYNESCPGIGSGKMADRKALEKLVQEQFSERSCAVSAELQSLAGEGLIDKDASIFRTHPGRHPERDRMGNSGLKEI